VKEFLRYV